MRRKLNNYMTQEELEALIEKYFECETTDYEESFLKRVLPECDYKSRVIDEALVTMGFYEVGRNKVKRKAARKVTVLSLRIASVAAMLALIVVFAVNFESGENGLSSCECIAYVNGEEIKDDETVTILMKVNLAEMNSVTEESSSVLESQLVTIRSIMSVENNN